MKETKSILVAVLVLIVMVIAGCIACPPTNTPTATPIPTPTATPEPTIAATATPTPTATPEPTIAATATPQPPDNRVTAIVLAKGPCPKGYDGATIHLRNISGPYKERGMDRFVRLDAEIQLCGWVNKTIWNQIEVNDSVILEPDSNPNGIPIVVGKVT